MVKLAQEPSVFGKLERDNVPSPSEKQMRGFKGPGLLVGEAKDRASAGDDLPITTKRAPLVLY